MRVSSYRLSPSQNGSSFNELEAPTCLPMNPAAPVPSAFSGAPRGAAGRCAGRAVQDGRSVLDAGALRPRDRRPPGRAARSLAPLGLTAGAAESPPRAEGAVAAVASAPRQVGAPGASLIAQPAAPSCRRGGRAPGREAAPLVGDSDPFLLVTSLPLIRLHGTLLFLLRPGKELVSSGELRRQVASVGCSRD